MVDGSRLAGGSEESHRLAPAGASAEPGLPLIVALLAAFVVVWTLYFAISDSPSVIHNDMAEAYAWGQEFQLGYNQHPPFWAWVCGAWFFVFPRTGWAFAILSSLNAGIGLCGAWMLVGNFARGHKRLAATALLLLTPFYTFLSYKYNANSIFLSIWPWTLHFFVRSLEHRRHRDAVLFGVLIGIAMLSKYYALILATTCLIAAVLHPDRRRYFTSASPYISVIVAALLCAPHAWWLLASGAPPVRYLSQIAGRPPTWTLLYEAKLLFGAPAMQIVVFLVIGLACRTTPRDWLAAFKRRWPDPAFRLLLTLALAPLVLTLLAGLALRLKLSTNMMIGTFSLVPLLAIEIAGCRQIERLSRIAVRFAVALSLGALLLSPAVAFAVARWSRDTNATQPRSELAREATRLWHEATALPLAYVAGSDLYENAVTFYSPDRPHGFIHFDFFRSRWVTSAALARGGLLAVCVKDDTACAASAAAFATPQSTRTEITLAHSAWGRTQAPVTFTLTITPPHD